MLAFRKAVMARVAKALPGHVWTPVDFLDLGSRPAVDKVLQRLVHQGQLRRIDRGFYDRPRVNPLTNQPAVADYRRIIDAIGRRDQVRVLVDGMTAANDIGLTTAVPTRVVIHTDARRRTIHLDNLVIAFKQTAPGKLYWAGRPAMRIVQALHWLKDTLPSDRERVLSQLATLLSDDHGRVLRNDLRTGLPTLPGWMQGIVSDLLSAGNDGTSSPVALGSRVAGKRAGSDHVAVICGYRPQSWPWRASPSGSEREGTTYPPRPSGDGSTAADTTSSRCTGRWRMRGVSTMPRRSEVLD